MLTTLLTIGSILRNQPGADGIRHHRYVRMAPKPQKGQKLVRYEIRVDNAMQFDLNDLIPLENENEFASLLYLNFKTSDADSMKKYIFGDICRSSLYKPQSDTYVLTEANFLEADPTSGAAMFKLNSLNRGEQDAETISNERINAFRACLRKQIDTLLEIFDSQKSVYLNFRFGDERKQWYEMDDEFSSINTFLMAQFTKKLAPSEWILTKSLHKTLDSSKAGLPHFLENSIYKSWLIDSEETFFNLLYAIDYSQKGMITKGDVKIVVLPRSEQEVGTSRISASELLDFFGASSIKTISAEEGKIIDEREALTDNEDKDEETPAKTEEREITLPYQRAANLNNITQFDFVFSKVSSSPSTPDVDVIELSGISKSRIGELDHQIKEIASTLYRARQERFEAKQVKLVKPLSNFNVLRSLNNIFAELGKDKKKFSSHILKILPQIYCGSYIQDDVLLPTFIATTERNLRDGSPNYDYLLFDQLFLWSLQDTNREGETMTDKIRQSKSYQAGLLLGKMARPLRVAINSFEKNYVGLLSRRISSIDDTVAFANFIDEKLIMHSKVYPDLRTASRDLAILLTEFGETYNREYCAFGFFESYFAPYQAKDEAEPDPDATENTAIDTEN